MVIIIITISYITIIIVILILTIIIIIRVKTIRIYGRRVALCSSMPSPPLAPQALGALLAPGPLVTPHSALGLTQQAGRLSPINIL